MNVLHRASYALSILAAFSVSATDINVSEAGTLQAAFRAAGEDASAVTSLTVSGTVDASDLFFIADNLTALRSLDLKNVNIVEYHGNKLKHHTHYAAAEIPAGTFAATPLTSVSLPLQQGLVIGEMAFSHSPITEIVFNDNISAIRPGAFANCTSLTSVSLPAGQVDTDAFANCTALKSADLSAVSILADRVFADCTALENVTNTEKLSYIGAGAFRNCTALTTFAFPADLVVIGNTAFEGSGLAAADLSACTSLSTVGDRAFASDANLESVLFPADANVTIGAGAFFEDTKLTQLTLPAAYETLPDYLLKDVPGVDLSHPSEKLVSVGDYALKGNTATTSVFFPAGIASLGDRAMEGMSSLHEIYVGKDATVPELGNDVWKDVDQKNVILHVYDDVADSFKAADQWKEFTFQIETGVNDAIAGTEEPTLKGRFAGTILQLSSVGEDIALVKIFDPSGRLLITVNPNASSTDIDTAEFAYPFFIVTAHLESGRQATLKMARR